jgi:tetraacyldisaccharide 4'-kinase
VLRARLAAGPDAAVLAGRRVMAFAGIARPEKFFASLSAAGAVLIEQIPLADHQLFTERLFGKLRDRARRLSALPVTTAKDAARLSSEQRAAIHIVSVHVAWDDEAAIEKLLDQVISCRNSLMNRSTSASSL